MKLKKYIREIFLILTMVVVSSIILFYSKNNDFVCNKNLETLSELIFGGLIGLIAIWMSAYFILIQLYKNSYPMEIIERDILKSGKMIIIFSFGTIIINALTIYLFDNIVAQIYLLILFVIDVAVIFFDSYRINRKLAVKTYIDKYFVDMKKKFTNNSVSEKDIDDVFFNYANFYNECVSKDEYYACSNIAHKTNEIFGELIEKCNQLYLNDKKEIAEYTLNKIIGLGIMQIRNADNEKDRSFIPKLFKQQENNIKKCLIVNNIPWFEKYLKNINVLSKQFKEDNILNQILILNVNIGLFLIDNR